MQQLPGFLFPGVRKVELFISSIQADIDQVVGKVIEAFAKKRQLEKRLKAVQRLLRESHNADKGEGKYELNLTLRLVFSYVVCGNSTE